MKNVLLYSFVTLMAGFVVSSAEANFYYSRPVYRYYQPVTYYQEVVEEVPVCAAEPVYVRRTYPVKALCHKRCHRPYSYSRHPFFGGFSFSIGF